MFVIHTPRLTAWLLLTSVISVARGQAKYLVGIGRGDITGPAADVNLMGYAMPEQVAHGIHIRLYARAFVFADAQTSSTRFLYIVIDAAMPSQLLTLKVVEGLQAEFNGVYSSANVAITATHTHSSPAGYLDHLLYHVTSLGFVKQSFDAMLVGILQASRAAHADLRPATLSWSAGELLGASINRSPTAYLENPEDERLQYQHDTDKEMTVLKIKAAGRDCKGRGLLSWFAVHCTSMNNTNTLLSGDNKGAAEQFVEKGWAPKQQDLEQGFTAAFAQGNMADTTPNTKGTFCSDSGMSCDVDTSTCHGSNQYCVGQGPAGHDDLENTRVIGQMQADKAQELWSSAEYAVTGPIDYRHVFINISDMEVQASNFTRAGRTCPGAMGYSFAAGTTDGPGATGFYQADEHTGYTPLAPVVRMVNAALSSIPSKEQVSCHWPKPILLNVGEAPYPYPWVPKVVGVSVLRLGNLVIVCVPGEFTTMAGRRIRNAVYETVKEAWGPDTKVVMNSITNTYASYVTTYEEYQVQRYEGGSTLYGRHTLDAYIQTAVQLAQAMVDGRNVTSQVNPEGFEDKLLSFLPPVIVDTVPRGMSFGDVISQPHDTYHIRDIVEVVFWSANPRNNVRTNKTFLKVERLDNGTNSWVVVHTDDDWCTQFKWTRPKGSLSSESTAMIRWSIPVDSSPGMYRIKHYGDARTLNGKVTGFQGVSKVFAIS